jgi:hypothetical protein
MWVAYWNETERLATLWFKLPELPADETKTLYAFWGFEYDTGVSDLRYLLGETVEDSIVYTDNLALGISTSGTSAGTLWPERLFDGDISDLVFFCQIEAYGWVQMNFNYPTKINKLRLFGTWRGNVTEWESSGFEFRASNDNFTSEDVLILDVNQVVGGPSWFEWFFGNDTEYTSYRITNDKVGPEDPQKWNVLELELMGINEAETVSTPVFRFGDDFNEAQLDVNKWPTSAGSWSINNSKINLATDAWIRSPDILGGQSTVWNNFEYELQPIDGLWGNHQHTGSCYLGYTGSLSNTTDDLIDGDITSYNTYLGVSRFGGCALGVDMGYTVSNVKKVRFYLYNYLENYNDDLYWGDPGAYNTNVTLWKSETNDAGDQTLIKVYDAWDLQAASQPRKAQDYVWYFDIQFDAPGESFRYLHMYGQIEFVYTPAYYFSEIKVYSDEFTTYTEPGAFMIEDGVITVGSPTSTSTAAHRYRCYGGDNVMGINYFFEGATDRSHDFVNAGTYVSYPGSNKGLIATAGSYNQTYFGYWEGNDHCYQGMTNRGGASNPVYSENLLTEPDYVHASGWNPGHPTAWLPINAIDGSLSTQWLSDSGNPSWWGYAFDSPQSISWVRVYYSGASAPEHEIQASNDDAADWDDKEWTVMYHGDYIPTSTTWEEMYFNNTVPYKYWRFVTWDSGGQGYAEIEMYKILYYDGEFDYEDSWERKVHRNTEVSNFRIYGEDSSSANGVEIDWVVVRDFEPDKEPFVNTSDLYVEYEYIGHQQLDNNSYGDDVTDVDFHHLTNMGGDPYRMSDNVTNSLINVFISDSGVTTGSITIDFGRRKDSITSIDYRHYNSSRVTYYNASKLSDLEEDVHGRDYWQTTTTSGWAAIMFPTTKDIASLALKAVPGETNRMAKDFKFYGSNSDPRLD